MVALLRIEYLELIETMYAFSFCLCDTVVALLALERE